ncbi:MAG TPA: cation:proton antiporter [Candidatus Binataceae bacterium]|nr:cation:proton antiporter [Candidatus Binataceae bacterium]
MDILQLILVLLLVAVMLAALARQIGVPSPSLLALGGVTVALIPNGPRFTLQPDLALALFVAPVLLDAAFDSPLRDLRRNWFPVTCLVIILVALTTIVVAMVAHWMMPAMPFAVCLTLGALVAPPDAAAASAVLGEINLPHRLLVVLEGESLLNDASALLIYRMAVAAALMNGGDKLHFASTLGLVLVGSIAFGIAMAFVFSELLARFPDAPSSIVIQFIGAFGVWILADRLGFSGVLAIVSFAIILSRRSGIRMPAAVRVPSYAVWETAVFVLNALAFVMIGLQLEPIVMRIELGQRYEGLRFAGMILLSVIGVRAAWMLFYNGALRTLGRMLRDGAPGWMPIPPWKGSILGAWCGMRGIVTLAAALALPDGSGGTVAFPYRDVILLAAFTVVIGTLVIQGLTLRAFAIALNLESDDTVELETRSGRAQIIRAAIDSLDSFDDDVAGTIRAELISTLARLQGESALTDANDFEYDLRTNARRAARESLTHLRLTGVIGDESFQRLEAELDMIELDTDMRRRW